MRYLALWAVFGVTIFGALLGLELLEGSKIGTTEYSGLRSIGFALLFIYMVCPLLVYPFSFLPLTWLARKFLADWRLRAAGYTCAAAALGAWLFDGLYDDRFVREYGLNAMTAVWLFAAAGLLYGLAERFVPLPRTRQ